jgi:hypothetical protein
MTTGSHQPHAYTGANVWVKWPTLDRLKQLRHGDEPLNDTIARLIRFAKRMRPAAEARVREEFLP